MRRKRKKVILGIRWKFDDDDDDDDNNNNNNNNNNTVTFTKLKNRLSSDDLYILMQKAVPYTQQFRDRTLNRSTCSVRPVLFWGSAKQLWSKECGDDDDNNNNNNLIAVGIPSGPGSAVGIATAYGLDGPGIESRWGRDFAHLSRPALRPT